MCPIINVVFFYFQVLHWAPLARSRRAFRSVSDCEYVSFKKKSTVNAMKTWSLGIRGIHVRWCHGFFDP